MLRRMAAIVTVMMAALTAFAQGDEDIAYSLNLPEAVVLADGMTFEEYLVIQQKG